ncbi:hypothetical protein GC163_19275 [bacterium]|nr:hypothetical protein [bacterium]
MLSRFRANAAGGREARADAEKIEDSTNRFLLRANQERPQLLQGFWLTEVDFECAAGDLPGGIPRQDLSNPITFLREASRYG